MRVKNEPSSNLGLIKEEYFFLQSQIEEFDKKALQIKQWSVTIALAGIGTAYWKAVPELLLLSAFSALAFWLLEAQWKSFQQAHRGRVDLIERFMQVPGQEIVPLQISVSWAHQYNHVFKEQWSEFSRIAFWRAVIVPHLLIAGAGIGLYVLAPPVACKIAP